MKTKTKYCSVLYLIFIGLTLLLIQPIARDVPIGFIEGSNDQILFNQVGPPNSVKNFFILLQVNSLKLTFDSETNRINELIRGQIENLQQTMPKNEIFGEFYFYNKLTKTGSLVFYLLIILIYFLKGDNSLFVLFIGVLAIVIWYLKFFNLCFYLYSPIEILGVIGVILGIFLSILELIDRYVLLPSNNK